jgi:hypothetical protein
MKAKNIFCIFKSKKTKKNLRKNLITDYMVFYPYIQEHDSKVMTNKM